MTKVEAIIRPDKLEAIIEELEKIGHSGITKTEVEGHGKQKGITEQFRGKEYRLTFIPKVKVEIDFIRAMDGTNGIFPATGFIGVENKLNYIYRKNGNLERSELVGLCALFNSQLFDSYFRIFNGNVNVSATELREMTLPPLETIKAIGNQIILSNSFRILLCFTSDGYIVILVILPSLT